MHTISGQQKAHKPSAREEESKRRRRMIEVGLVLATVAWFALWSQVL